VKAQKIASRFSTRTNQNESHETEQQRIDEHHPEEEGQREEERVADADLRAKLQKPDDDDHQAQDEVRRAHDPQVARADQELHVHRLEQVEVERADAHVFHEPLERRRKHEVHPALDEVIDAEQHDHLRERPAVDRRRVSEHDQDRADARPDDEEHLEDAQVEVAAVFHLELELGRGEGAEHTQVADHAPTALYSRRPTRHAKRNARIERPSQNACPTRYNRPRSSVTPPRNISAGIARTYANGNEYEIT